MRCDHDQLYSVCTSRSFLWEQRQQIAEQQSQLDEQQQKVKDQQATLTARQLQLAGINAVISQQKARVKQLESENPACNPAYSN